MSDVFIAHVEEDADVALEIALGLEEAGYTTWCYEVDSIPGPSYLIQTGRAVEEAKAVIVLISPHSVGSRQVTKEVVRAHESGKEFIPILRDITHIEFQNRQPEWREAVGAAASIRIPREGVADIMPRIINGLSLLGIEPSPETNAPRIAQIGRALDELRRLPISEKAEEPPMATRRLEPEAAAVRAPPAKVAEGAGRQRRWIKPALIGASSVVIIALIAVALAKQFEGTGEQTGAPPTTPAVTQESAATTPAVDQESATGAPEQTPPPPTVYVTFPDKNLKEVIRNVLGKPAGDEIRATELANLGGLEAGRQNIVDLTGIEYCVKMDSLNLMGNRISDISALSSLTNLYELNLHRNQISDVSALSSLTNLYRLYLHENQISYIRALSSLTNLTRLDLGGNKVSDVSPLSSLVNLTALYLWENEVRDASPLSSLTKLTVLQISGNQVSDISALSSLTSLEELHLNGNQIVDISSLASLNSLAKLSLSGNRVSDLGALSSLTNLEQLDLAGSRISDVSPLSSLTNISWLELSGNQISDISALSSLTNLSFLNLEGNQISDILSLVANIGLAEGDRVNLRGNPLSATSLDMYIPQLEQRGVIVELD